MSSPAGRLSSLDLGELHARLDRSLDLLGDGSVTLRQTLEWSYDLLPEHEQRLFRYLGVFPDGFDLPTAEFAGAELDLRVDAAGALAHLVDASMVEATLGDTTRYSMLDTLRSFTRDLLETHGEGRAATELFVRWARDLAASVDRALATSHEAHADRRLRREVANLRAAWRVCREQHRLDDAVRLVVGLAEAAGWRDLTEVWEWALELADDPAIAAHADAGFVFGLAAGTAWSRGEIERADRLAQAGLQLGGGDWPCLAALAMIALSRGHLTDAIDLGASAADLAARPDQSLGIAALAAAYHGNLEQASAFADRLAAIATSPTIEGFSHYVAAEIDALAGSTDQAATHYGQAIMLTRQSGATFVDGVASVGLVSLRARVGQTSDALDAYWDLIDYWERTGGWIQQWTTLRNLARLLRTLDDTETPLFLEAAARSAPDAPVRNDGEENPDAGAVPDDRAAKLREEAATASRTRVLEDHAPSDRPPPGHPSDVTTCQGARPRSSRSGRR